MRYLKTAFVVAIIGVGVSGHAIGHSIDLWTVLPDPCRADSESDLGSSCLVVKVNGSILRQASVDLRLTLPRNVVVQVTRVHAGAFEKDGYIWQGVIQGASYSDVNFSAVDDVVVGTIVLENMMYRLRLSPNGDQVVEELVQKLLSNGGSEDAAGSQPPPEPPGGASLDSSAGSGRLNCYEIMFTDNLGDDGGGNAPNCPQFSAPCGTDSPNQIDVMVLYTPNAETAAGGNISMTAWIYLQAFLTNRTFTESNLSQQIRLVHREQIAVTTDQFGKDLSNDSNLKNLTKQCDTELDRAHTLRDTHKADVVMLLTRRSNSAISGLSNQMLDENVADSDYSDFAPCAFGVVDAGVFMSSDYTFAHELGHVMGAQHNFPSDAGAIPASSFGYMKEPAPTGCQAWMTIMAERGNQGCDGDNCKRLPLWSNMDSEIRHCGNPVGSSSARNRDTLSFTARTVANFRCGSSTPGNVWMKDTWEDTGAEPDQATAAQAMWKSPYIWVRRAQDPGPMFEAQHLSEWPLPNQINYVYVKLHNGGGATSGKLELWKAQIGTAAQWQGSFTLLGTKTVTDFDANSTRIFEFPWTPDTNSYGFIARWDSQSDPMAQAEGNDPDANARANNNIAWHNVSVVELVQGSSIGVTTFLQNLERNPERVLVLIRPSDPDPRRSLFGAGQAMIKLDRTLMAAWKQGGYQGSGFRRVPFRGIQITDPKGATLGGMLLQPGVRSTLTISVQDPRKRNLNGTFLFDVIQKQQGRLGLRAVGGATFEVRASSP